VSGSIWGGIRSLRHDPPASASGNGDNRHPRLTTFQAAIEQCEQFIKAASTADYATRPVHLFYAMSQGSRAVVAASPRLAANDWHVYGHGLSAWTQPKRLPEVTVHAYGNGLFQAMATALGFQPLVPDEKITLGELWPLIPESINRPLDPKETLSAIMFEPGVWPQHHLQYGASIHWIRHSVPEAYGQDKEALARHFGRYPALKDLSWKAALDVPWRTHEFAADLDIHFDMIDGEKPPLIQPGNRLVAQYGGGSRGRWQFLTPALGSMTGPLHPVLAWWAVLLALSSLARYEPANWAKIIDVNKTSYATAIEYILDDAIVRIPEMLLNMLSNIDDPG
jgi:hypothetical protein